MREVNTADRIPRIYPDGRPLYWRSERTEELKGAIQAWRERREITPLFVDYLNYWIDAPVWKGGPNLTEVNKRWLDKLIERSARLQTAEEVDQWLYDCRLLAIDPL